MRVVNRPMRVRMCPWKRITSEGLGWNGNMSSTRRSVSARLPNDLLHLIEIALEGLATRSRDSVFGAWHASIKALGADDVFGFFQLAGMDAQIAVRSFQQAFQLRESESVTNGECTDNPQAHTLVDYGIEFGGRSLFSRGN